MTGFKKMILVSVWLAVVPVSFYPGNEGFHQRFKIVPAQLAHTFVTASLAATTVTTT